MSEIPKTAQGDDITLPYYHGAVLDMDVDKVLTADGDYCLQSKHIYGVSKPRLFLAVRWGKQVQRVEVKREGRLLRIRNNTYPSVHRVVERHSKEPLLLKDEKILLKRAIPKGKFQMSHADIKMMKKIGQGAYGTVYRGLMLRDNKTIAVKRLEIEEGREFDEEALNEMMKEARVMQLYDHRNIVRFYGFIVDRMPYLLVMEYCDSGSVEDKLRNSGKKLSVAQRIDITTQAAQGLEYLHSKECIHRDIATRNCLLDRRVVKLADFGMCRPTSVYKVDLNKPTNVRWLAPEVWRIGETRYNTDVYAFGVMIWEMFEMPYQCPYNEMEAGQVKKKVMEGYRMPPPKNIPKEMVAIMELAWHHNPDKRPTASVLYKMLEACYSSGTTKSVMT